MQMELRFMWWQLVINYPHKIFEFDLILLKIIFLDMATFAFC